MYSAAACTLADSDYFGWSVANIGDINSDGISDIAVGAVYDATGGANRGAVHILFMNADGTVKSLPSPVKIASGTNGGPTLVNNDYFGSSVANIGDLNGDGINDIAVGATGNTAGGIAYSGAVHILFMNADGTVKSLPSPVKIASGTNGGPTITSVGPPFVPDAIFPLNCNLLTVPSVFINNMCTAPRSAPPVSSRRAPTAISDMPSPFRSPMFAIEVPK